MDRRQFLTTSFDAVAACFAPHLSIAGDTSARKELLILHTEVIRPKVVFVSPDNVHLPLYSYDKPCLIDHDITLSPGENLDIVYLYNDMGHHFISLRKGEFEVARFVSSTIGRMFEKGEPLLAVITDKRGMDSIRVDLFPNRPVRKGERIPLLCQTGESCGMPAQRVKGEPFDSALVDQWQPLEVLSNHRYRPEHFPSPAPVKLSGYEECDNLKIKFPRGLLRLSERDKRFWNSSPWNELDAGVAVLKVGEKDFAYVEDNMKFDILPLLMRNEKVEAKIVGTGDSMPRELLVNLALVA